MQVSDRRLVGFSFSSCVEQFHSLLRHNVAAVEEYTLLLGSTWDGVGSMYRHSSFDLDYRIDTVVVVEVVVEDIVVMDVVVVVVPVEVEVV